MPVYGDVWQRDNQNGTIKELEQETKRHSYPTRTVAKAGMCLATSCLDNLLPTADSSVSWLVVVSLHRLVLVLLVNRLISPFLVDKDDGA